MSRSADNRGNMNTPIKTSAADKKPGFRVLVTSIGNKVPLLSAVRNALIRFTATGELIGGDSDPGCTGRYFVDRFMELPKDEDLKPELFIALCREADIDAVIPTRDAELPFFSRNRQFFSRAGIALLVADLGAVETCLDKLEFSNRLQQLGFAQVIPSSTGIHDIKATALVVKERFGTGSRTQRLNISANEALDFASTLIKPIFQPFIAGREYSVDLYLDRAGRLLGAVSRSRDKIVSGEAQISTTTEAPELEKVCADIAGKLRLTGHILFQAIIDKQRRIHIVECNCRFGGASTLSLTAGLESLLWFFSEACDRPPEQFPFSKSDRPLRQVRHPADLILEPFPLAGEDANE